MSPAETPPYPGFNVLLEGHTGSGKTYALHTLVESGLEVFVIFLEPGVEALIAPWADNGKPVPKNLHWNILPGRVKDGETLRGMIEKSGRLSQSMLAKDIDVFRADNNPALPIIDVINSFEDHRTKQNFGPAAEWGTDRVLVIDHLSAVNDRFLDMMTGSRVARDKPDYGIAQTNYMNLQEYLINGCKCHFVLIAHIDRLTDEVHGGYKNMTKSIGVAISSSIPIPFSDVILAERVIDKWYWNTADANTDLKTRNLPVQPRMPPDFRHILKKWELRKAAAEKEMLT